MSTLQNGSRNRVHLRLERPSYKTMHQRINDIRGSAKNQMCECGSPAEDWAYDHSGFSEIEDEQGRRYSTDHLCYAAKCKSCHRKFDNNETCRNGHPRTEENTKEYRGWRRCLDCQRENTRVRNERNRKT